MRSGRTLPTCVLLAAIVLVAAYDEYEEDVLDQETNDLILDADAGDCSSHSAKIKALQKQVGLLKARNAALTIKSRKFERLVESGPVQQNTQHTWHSSSAVAMPLAAARLGKEFSVQKGEAADLEENEDVAMKLRHFTCAGDFHSRTDKLSFTLPGNSDAPFLTCEAGSGTSKKVVAQRGATNFVLPGCSSAQEASNPTYCSFAQRCSKLGGAKCLCLTCTLTKLLLRDKTHQSQKMKNCIKNNVALLKLEAKKVQSAAKAKIQNKCLKEGGGLVGFAPKALNEQFMKAIGGCAGLDQETCTLKVPLFDDKVFKGAKEVSAVAGINALVALGVDLKEWPFVVSRWSEFDANENGRLSRDEFKDAEKRFDLTTAYDEVSLYATLFAKQHKCGAESLTPFLDKKVAGRGKVMELLRKIKNSKGKTRKEKKRIKRFQRYWRHILNDPCSDETQPEKDEMTAIFDWTAWCNIARRRKDRTPADQKELEKSKTECNAKCNQLLGPKRTRVCKFFDDDAMKANGWPTVSDYCVHACNKALRKPITTKYGKKVTVDFYGQPLAPGKCASRVKSGNDYDSENSKLVTGKKKVVYDETCTINRCRQVLRSMGRGSLYKKHARGLHTAFKASKVEKKKMECGSIAKKLTDSNARMSGSGSGSDSGSGSGGKKAQRRGLVTESANAMS